MTRATKPKWLGAALAGAGAMLVVALAVGALLLTTGVISAGADGPISAAADGPISARADGAATLEGPGYTSPEQAVEAYVNAMQQGDVNAMIRTFAIETYGKHADGALMVERSAAWLYLADPNLPLGGDNGAINAEVHLARLLNAVHMQYITLSAPPFDTSSMISPGSPIEGVNAPDVAALNTLLSATFDGTAFTSITDAQMFDWEAAAPHTAELFHLPQNQASAARWTKPLGADEISNRAAILTTAHGQWALFLQLNRYGDRWWVGDFAGMPGQLANADASGLVRLSGLQ